MLSVDNKSENELLADARCLKLIGIKIGNLNRQLLNTHPYPLYR